MSRRKHALINQGESDTTANLPLACGNESSQFRINVSLSQSCSNGLRTTGNEILPSDRECKCCSPTSCSTNFGLSAKSNIDELGPEHSPSPYASKGRKGECHCANQLRATVSPTPAGRGEGSEQSVSVAINILLKVGGKSENRPCSQRDTEDSWMEQPNQLSYLAETVSRYPPGSPQPPNLSVPHQQVPVASDYISSEQLMHDDHLGEPGNNDAHTPFYPADQLPLQPFNLAKQASQIVEEAIKNAVKTVESTSKPRSLFGREVVSVVKSVRQPIFPPMGSSQTEDAHNIPVSEETHSWNLNISTRLPDPQQYTNEECVNIADMEDDSEARDYRQAGRLLGNIVQAARDRVHLKGQPEKQACTEGGCHLQATLSETRDQLLNTLPASADTDHSQEQLLQEEALPIQRDTVEEVSCQILNVLLSEEPTTAASGVGECVRQDDEDKLRGIIGQPSWEPHVDVISPNNEQQSKLEPSPGHITMVNLQINNGKGHKKESRKVLDEDRSLESLEVQHGSQDEHIEQSSASSLTEQVNYVFLPVDKTGKKSKSTDSQYSQAKLLLRTASPTNDNGNPLPPDALLADNTDSPNKPHTTVEENIFLPFPDGLSSQTVFSLSPENLANRDLPTTSAPTDIVNVEVPASLNEGLINESVADNVDYFPIPGPLLVSETHGEDVDHQTNGKDIVDTSTMAVFSQEKVGTDNAEPLQSTNTVSDTAEVARSEKLPTVTFENGGTLDITDLEVSVQPGELQPTPQANDFQVVDAIKPADLAESPRQEQVSHGKLVPLQEGHQVVEDTFDETLHGILSNRELISDSHGIVPSDTNLPQMPTGSNLEQQPNEEIEKPEETITRGSQSRKMSEHRHRTEIDPWVIGVVAHDDAELSTGPPLLQGPIAARSPSPSAVICEEVGTPHSEVLKQSAVGSPPHSNMETGAGQTPSSTGSGGSRAKAELASGGSVVAHDDAELSTGPPLLQGPIAARSPSPSAVICEEVGTPHSEVIKQSAVGFPPHSNMETGAGQTPSSTGSGGSRAKAELASGGSQSGRVLREDIAGSSDSGGQRRPVSLKRPSENSMQPDAYDTAMNDQKVNLDTSRLTGNMPIVSSRDYHPGCTCGDALQTNRINVEICLNMCSSCMCSSGPESSSRYAKPPPPPPDGYFIDGSPEPAPDSSHKPDGAGRFSITSHSPKSNSGMRDAVGWGKQGTADAHQTNKRASEGGKSVESGLKRPNIFSPTKEAAIFPASPVSEPLLSTSFQYLPDSLSEQTKQPVCLINNLAFGNLVESDQPKSFVHWGDNQDCSDLQLESLRSSMYSTHVGERRGRLHHEKAREFRVVEIPVLPKYGSTQLRNPISIPDVNHSKECRGATPDSELGTKLSPTKISSTSAQLLSQLAPVACSNSGSPSPTEANAHFNNRTHVVPTTTVVNSRDPVDFKTTRNDECAPSEPSSLPNRLFDTKLTGDVKNTQQGMPNSVRQDSALSDSLASFTGVHERSLNRRNSYYAVPRKWSTAGIKAMKLKLDDNKKVNETESTSFTSVSVTENLTSKRLNVSLKDAGNDRPRATEFDSPRRSSSDLPMLPSPIGTVDYLRQFRNYSFGQDSTPDNPIVGLFRRKTTQPDDVVTDIGQFSRGWLKYSKRMESQEDMTALGKKSESGEISSLLLRPVTNTESLKGVSRGHDGHIYNTKKCCDTFVNADEYSNRTSLRDTVKTRQCSYQSSFAPGFHRSSMPTSIDADSHSKVTIVKGKSNKLSMASLDYMNDISPRTNSIQPFRPSSKFSSMPHHQKSTISQLLKQRHSPRRCICCHDNSEGCVCLLSPSSRKTLRNTRGSSLSSTRYYCHRRRPESLLIQSLNISSNLCDESRRSDQFITEGSCRPQQVFPSMSPKVGGGDLKNGPATSPWDNPLTNSSIIHFGEKIIDCLPVVQYDERHRCFCKCHNKTDSAVF